jgi:hypothetical protein
LRSGFNLLTLPITAAPLAADKHVAQLTHSFSFFGTKSSSNNDLPSPTSKEFIIFDPVNTTLLLSNAIFDHDYYLFCLWFKRVEYLTQSIHNTVDFTTQSISDNRPNTQPVEITPNGRERDNLGRNERVRSQVLGTMGQWLKRESILSEDGCVEI